MQAEEVKNMNIKHLSYVVEICRCGSINKAAQNLYISQSSLSGSVKSLEEELHYQLFRRKNSGIELTEEGKLFLESAKKILAEAEKIYRVPEQFSSQRNLSVSCTYSTLLMQSFILFKKSHPAPAVQDAFKETGLIQTIRDVIAQQYRLCIFYCFQSRREYHARYAARYNMVVEPLCEGIPAVALLSRQNPLSSRRDIRLEDLPTRRLVTYENFEYEDWLGMLGIPASANVLYIFDRGGLLDAVRKDNYMAVVMYDPQQQRELSDCVTLPITGFSDTLDVCLMRSKSYTLNAREKKFVQFCKKRFQTAHEI